MEPRRQDHKPAGAMTWARSRNRLLCGQPAHPSINKQRDHWRCRSIGNPASVHHHPDASILHQRSITSLSFLALLGGLLGGFLGAHQQGSDRQTVGLPVFEARVLGMSGMRRQCTLWTLGCSGSWRLAWLVGKLAALGACLLTVCQLLRLLFRRYGPRKIA